MLTWAPKGTFTKKTKRQLCWRTTVKKSFFWIPLLPHSNDGKCPAGSKEVKQKRSKIATASIFKTRLKLYAILTLKKKVLKMRSNAKVLRFHCNKCNAISENYSEKNFCLLTCLKLPPPVSQFIFLATVRKMNWKRCIFPASQIVAQFIMASIMWKVPQYYWIVSAYTSNTFFFCNTLRQQVWV